MPPEMTNVLAQQAVIGQYADYYSMLDIALDVNQEIFADVANGIADTLAFNMNTTLQNLVDGPLRPLPRVLTIEEEMERTRAREAAEATALRMLALEYSGEWNWEERAA